MSGRTGKMTQDAIDARGPRHVLARRRDNGKMFYYEDGQEHAMASHYVVAKSYSMGYLRRIERGNA